MKKYVKLFEEYTEGDQKDQNSETSHTWSDLRDAIQMKMPYFIVTFNTPEGYNKFIAKFLTNKEYIKQMFFSLIDGKKTDFPSVFVFDNEQNSRNSIKDYYTNEYSIRHIITNEMNGEHATMYFSDGSSTTAGNEIVSTNTPTEMQNEDYYQIGSTYYRFITN